MRMKKLAVMALATASLRRFSHDSVCCMVTGGKQLEIPE